MNALCLVRHAIAEERGTAWSDDRLRPLTRDGIRRMEVAARGLATVVPRGSPILSSPLVRAWQTAEIVAKAVGARAIRRCDALATGAHSDLLREANLAGAGTVIAVGHEPHISGCLSWLLTGEEAAISFEVKKGAAALVAFPGDAGPGMGTLRWFLPPRVLRSLGA